jgi:hypothetical protein
MGTNTGRGLRGGVVRTARGMLLAGAIGVLLTRPDIASEARDALLGILSVMLAVTALASDRGESLDEIPTDALDETPVEETSWRERARERAW